MKFFFDESGSFSVTESAPHIMVGILIPDTKVTHFLSFYEQFVKSLNPDEFKNGEPKGSALKDQTRERLFKYLGANPWIRIAVSVSDSQFNDQKQIEGYRREQVKLYEAHYKNGLVRKVSPDLTQLQKDLLDATRGGISDVQFVKGLLLFSTLYALLHGSVIAYEDAVYDPCWSKFTLTFDRQHRTIITPMEKWINNEFMHFIQEQSKRDSKPLAAPDSWTNRKHPFISTFKDGINNRIVLNKIFKDGFQFEDSQKSPGLQYADWIANTVRQVLYKKRHPSILDLIRPNLVGLNKSRIIPVHIYKADKKGIFNKYKDWLY